MSRLPVDLTYWLDQHHYGSPQRQRNIGGGCINEASRLEFDDGRVLFLKTHTSPPDHFFESEALSLIELDKARSGLSIPQALNWGSDYLLMTYLPAGMPADDYWEQLGSGLARQHQVTTPRHGLQRLTYCGLTPQNNNPAEDGYEFFRDCRLLALGQRAREKGLLPNSDFDALAHLAFRLKDLIPEQPASLLHGDLWSGNQYAGPEGQPVLVDPALSYGWREADLAMTQLFGGFSPRFYQAYHEAWPLEPGWRERFPLYNLYHQLNHLLLFGTSYLQGIRSTLNAFV